MDDSSKGQASETETLGQELNDLGKDFSSISGDVKKVAVDSAKQLDNEVELHPFITASAAFGVGLIIGWTLGRR